MLFDAFSTRGLTLANRIVMSPMTRSRAVEANTPNAHLVDHSAMGAPPVPADFKLKLRHGFEGSFILSGGFDRATAETALAEKRGDLVAFGRPFLANPDLVARMRQNAALNATDPATFYTPGPKGYTDYPTLPR